MAEKRLFVMYVIEKRWHLRHFWRRGCVMHHQYGTVASPESALRDARRLSERVPCAIALVDVERLSVQKIVSDPRVEGFEASLEELPPPQVWCPRCDGTIIDPVVEKMCVQCENLTNGGIDGSEA